MKKGTVLFIIYCIVMVIISATEAGPWVAVPVGVVGIVGIIYFDYVKKC